MVATLQHLLLAAEYFVEEFSDWVVELIHNAFFQRNDSVVSYVNVFRADLGAAFRDVTHPDAALVFEQFRSVERV